MRKQKDPSQKKKMDVKMIQVMNEKNRDGVQNDPSKKEKMFQKDPKLGRGEASQKDPSKKILQNTENAIR